MPNRFLCPILSHKPTQIIQKARLGNNIFNHAVDTKCWGMLMLEKDTGDEHFISSGQGWRAVQKKKKKKKINKQTNAFQGFTIQAQSSE